MVENQASKIEEPVDDAEQILDDVLNDENAAVENESNEESLK
jgi:hypothetical protein